MKTGLQDFKKVELKGSGDINIITTSNATIDAGKMVLKGHDFIIIPSKTELNGVAYLEDGIVPFRCIVTMSTENQINLDVVKAGAKEDRRDALKIPVNIKEHIISMKSTGTSRKYIDIDDEIRVFNISMGGIGFMSNRPYFKHQKVLIRIEDIKGDFEIWALILRRNRLKPSDKYRYSYGCKFINCSENKSRIICEYVFKKQIEGRRLKDVR